jgi:ribosomal protein S18 acetylase RimI-like enzyme
VTEEPTDAQSGAEVELHQVTPDDWESYREIRLEMLLDSPDAYWFTHDEAAGFTEAKWRENVGRGWLVSARIGADAVGSAGLGTQAEPGQPDRAVLWGMYVTPRVRGRGVGERLVRAVLDEASRRGVSEVFLEVTSGNDRALELYERCGFERTGLTRPHPRRPDLHEIEMVWRPRP